MIEYGFILQKVRKIHKKIDGRFSFEAGHQIANKIDGIFVIVSPIINAIFIVLCVPLSYLSAVKNAEMYI